MYNSFAIVGKMNRAKQLAQTYNIQSVPTIIVDGKFITASDKVGGHAQHAGGDRRADRQGARRAAEVVASPSTSSTPRDARLPHRRVVGPRRGARAALRGAAARRSGLFARREAELARRRRGARAGDRGDLRRRRARRRRAGARRRRFHRALRRARRRHRQRRRLARHARPTHAEDLPAFRAVFDTNVLGIVAHVPAVRRADARGARAARSSASRASPAFAACRAPARTSASKAAAITLSREPARRAARQRRRRRHDLPGLHRDADDRAQSVPDAVPDWRPTTRRASIARAIARRRRFYVLPWQMAMARARCCACCRGRSTTASFAKRGAQAAPASIEADRCAADVDWAGVAHAPAAARARIACLVPSLTELLFALGLGDQRRRAHRLLRPSARGVRARAEDRRHQGPRPRRAARAARRRISSSTSTRTGARSSTRRARSCRTSSSRIRWRRPTTCGSIALFGAIFGREREAAALAARLRRGARATRRGGAPRCRASACST